MVSGNGMDELLQQQLCELWALQQCSDDSGSWQLRLSDTVAAAVDPVHSEHATPHVLLGDVGGTLLVRAHAEQHACVSIVAGASAGEQLKRSVRRLPPLAVDFSLPCGYPTEQRAQLTIASDWAPDELLARCESATSSSVQSADGLSVLYDVALCVADVLHDWVHCGSGATVDCDAVVAARQVRAVGGQSADDGVALLHHLLQYDEKQLRNEFSSAWFECQVCLASERGCNSVIFPPCSHTFCVSCVRQHFGTKIADGVLQLNCLATDCDTAAPPHLVRTVLLGAEGDGEPVHAESSAGCEKALGHWRSVYERWERLTLTRGLDSMSDLTTCPRCGTYVVLEAAATLMGHCAKCSLAFCAFCRRTYHGVQPCSLLKKDASRVANDYMSGDNEVRAALERRYGRDNVRRCVDDMLASSWIDGNTKACPSCSASIERSAGCNKMHCARCGTHFCWLCTTPLPADAPYEHFNESAKAKSACVGMLFAGAVDADGDDEDYVDFELYVDSD